MSQNTITSGGGGGTAPLSQSNISDLMTGNGFTTFGIITVGVIFWVASQNATGEARSLINMFLFTLLASMVLLNWWSIYPIFFKGGATNG